MNYRNLVLILLNIFAFQNIIEGQKTNFELVDSLVFLSAEDIALYSPNGGDYILNFNSSEDYLILKSKIITHLQKFNFEIIENQDTGRVLNYNLDEVRLDYSDVFRDGFLGTFLVNRTIEIKGSYFVKNGNRIGKTREFYFVLNDSVTYSDISRIENIAYSFTNTDLPEEPFFSSTLEPILAIGTAAVAVYLFFNIRSK